MRKSLEIVRHSQSDYQKAFAVGRNRLSLIAGAEFFFRGNEFLQKYDDDDSSRTLSSDELHKHEVNMVRKKINTKHHHAYREVSIPSFLEQAIKAEPKVERINSPCIQLSMIEETPIQSPPRTKSPAHI